MRQALNQSKSPLAALVVLKKICSHPALLNERVMRKTARAGMPQRLLGLGLLACLLVK